MTIARCARRLLPSHGKPTHPHKARKAAERLLHGAGVLRAAAAVQRCRGYRQHLVGMPYQQVAVPAEEEVAVLAIPAAALGLEEPRVPDVRVVAACVVRPAQAPVGRRL